jgi:hypothetical protein
VAVGPASNVAGTVTSTTTGSGVSPEPQAQPVGFHPSSNDAWDWDIGRVRLGFIHTKGEYNTITLEKNWIILLAIISDSCIFATNFQHCRF